MVDKLLQITGIDRRVSSSYSPRSQGAIEVFNKIFADMLRKCAEADKNNWHKFIPFVLLAYRTKVHESTKLTPFEIIYGRKANNFCDWNAIPSSEESSQLANRTLELRKLFEDTIPLVRTNLSKAGERQKEIQNKHDLITTKIIPVNTQVYIRAEGLLTKMANRFYGPYTVIGQTEGGNYVLKNALNEEMKNSFPRQKLKIVETIETDGEINLEIDKVIDSKIENNQEFYLVKWKNSTDQDWLPITAFNSVDCISAYNKEKAFQSEILTRRADDTAKNNNSNTTISNKRKNKKVPLELAKDQEKTINKPLITKRGRGRPRIHPLVSTIISSIIFIISFILKVNLVNSIEVKSDFIFCDTNDRTLIDINKSCRKEKSHEERIPISSKDGRIKALIDFDIEEKF